LLPIGPRSALHWTLLEAEIAGIEKFILITDEKLSLKSFLPHPTSENLSTSNPRHASKTVIDEWERLLKKTILVPTDTSIPAGGFASEIASAQEIIGQNRFAVLLPDAIVFKPEQGLSAVVKASGIYKQWAVGLTNIRPDQFDEFGVVKTQIRPDGSLKITHAVEKPGSSMKCDGIGIAGRYVFSADIFTFIKEFHQLPEMSKNQTYHPTTIIDYVAKNEGVTGVMMESQFYHIGIMQGYLAAWRFWATTSGNE
jgi:UTP--glucose-1-phosphate uridylyltransferase